MYSRPGIISPMFTKLLHNRSVVWTMPTAVTQQRPYRKSIYQPVDHKSNVRHTAAPSSPTIDKILSIVNVVDAML